MDSKSAPPFPHPPGLTRPHSYSSRTHKPSPLRYSTAYSTSNTSLSTSEPLQEPTASPTKSLNDSELTNSRTTSKTRFERSTRKISTASLRVSSQLPTPTSRPLSTHSQLSSNNVRFDKVTSSIATSSRPALPESHVRLTPRSSGEMNIERMEHAQLRPVSSIHWDATADFKARTESVQSQSHRRSISFLPFWQPKPSSELQIHPLLLYSRSQTIAYDVTQPPSRNSFIDRRTGSAVSVSKHTLSQSVAKPSTSTTLVLKSSSFPWTIQATSSSTKSETNPDSKTPSVKSGSNGLPVTNLVVLSALHVTLSARVDPQEWAALGHGSRAQKRILQEYERRCVRNGGSWDEGVRRIDYLCGKTLLIGIEVKKDSDKCGSIGRLLFAKP